MTALPSSTITVETLPVIAYQDVRVLTTELLAQLYGAEEVNIRNNFMRNQDRFQEGKHFFKLEGENLRQFKELHRPNSVGSVELHRVTERYSVEISPRVKALTLWTERGAARHAKMLDTDEAWSVFEKLEDAYFKTSASKAMTLGEQCLASAQAIVAMEREQARQATAISRLEHRVDLMDGDTGYMTVTAYIRNLGRRIPLSKAQSFGQKAAKAAKSLGVMLGNVPDERFGTVHSYPIALLREVADEFFGQEEAA